MKKVTLILMVLLVSSFASVSFASMSEFLGTWKNVDPNTAGMTRLQIMASGDRVWVKAWGQCHPTDCYWGMVEATAYAPAVGDDLVASAHSMIAEYDHGFSERMVIIHVLRFWWFRYLQVETMTHFKDASGRTDYSVAYIFTRSGVMPELSDELGPIIEPKKTEVANEEPALVKEMTLQQNFPNPFNPETTIQFNLPEARQVELKIYNSLGQEIRSLLNTNLEMGQHRVVWDGKDHSGLDVPSGMYFYQLRAGDFSQIRKMTLMR